MSVAMDAVTWLRTSLEEAIPSLNPPYMFHWHRQTPISYSSSKHHRSKCYPLKKEVFKKSESLSDKRERSFPCPRPKAFSTTINFPLATPDHDLPCIRPKAFSIVNNKLSFTNPRPWPQTGTFLCPRPWTWCSPDHKLSLPHYLSPQ